MSEALISAVNISQQIVASTSIFNLEFLVAIAKSSNMYQLQHTPSMVWSHGMMEFTKITIGTTVTLYKMFMGAGQNQISFTVNSNNLLTFNSVQNGGFYFLLIFAY